MANKLIIHKNELNHIGLMRTITLTELTQIFRLYLISCIVSYALSQQHLQLAEFPELSHINTVQQFTLDIESDVNDGNDLFIHTKWFFSGRRCLKPSITFIYEAIDQDQYGEYIEIFPDNTFTANITQCKSETRACGTMKTCLNNYPFPNIDTASYLEVGIRNTAGVTALCNNPTRAIRAQLTITCGDAYALEYDATKTFDLSHYNILNPPKSTYQYYTNHIYTQFGEHLWTLYDASFTFTGTACYEPTLSFAFEDADYGGISEWLEIYAPDFMNNVSRCHGGTDNNCGLQFRCLNDYKLYKDAFTPYSQIPIGILKTPDVSDRYCGSTINATVTVRCTINVYNINQTINIYGSNKYKLPLIQSTVAYDKNIKYNLLVKFTNGSCLYPHLTLNFQETDFAAENQWLEISTASSDVSITKCNGLNSIDECEWDECIRDQDMNWLIPAEIDELNLLIIKSSHVKSLHCGYTLNMEIIINCTGNPTLAPNTNSGSIKPTLVILPTLTPSVNAPEYVTATRETSSKHLKKQEQGFNNMLILYGVILVLFGVGISICAMCVYKKYKKYKQRDITGDMNSIRKHSDIKHKLQSPEYESLKSFEYDNDAQVEGKEMELIKKEAIGELNTYMNDSTDGDSIEEMFVERNSIERQVTAGGDETPIMERQNTGGLPKITPQISLMGLDESNGVYSNCHQCGEIKQGKNDKNDGLFYCFECWREFEQVEISYN